MLYGSTIERGSKSNLTKMADGKLEISDLASKISHIKESITVSSHSLDRIVGTCEAISRSFLVSCSPTTIYLLPDIKITPCCQDMPNTDPLVRLRSFPKAPPPNHDASAIQGSITLEEKQLNANIFAYHIAHSSGSNVFANKELSGLKLVEVNVIKSDDGKTLQGRTVSELVISESMLNVHGTMAGGFAATLLDICTFSSLFAVGLPTGVDASGVSTAMNLLWHGPAALGTVLRIVSTSLTIGGRASASRAEVYDATTGRLLVSAVHTMAPLKAAPPSTKYSGKARL